MSDQTDLFAQNQEKLTADQLLVSLKNDNGDQKYADLDTAMKGLVESQEHIKRIEQENASLREQQSKAATLDTIIEKLSTKQPSETIPETFANAEAVAQPEQVDVAAQVEAILAQRAQVDQAKANTDMVVSKLQETYGKDAGSKLYTKFGELGLSQQETNELIESRPKLVLATLGVDRPATARATPQTSSVSTAAFQQEPAPKVGNAFKSSTTSMLTSEWNAHKQIINDKYGIKG